MNIHIKGFLKKALTHLFGWVLNLNKSSEVQCKAAWRKIGWRLLGTSSFTFLTGSTITYIYANVPNIGFVGWALISVLTLLTVYVDCREFGRFVVSWKGFWPKEGKIKFGFFGCPDCRRVDPASHMPEETLDDGLVRDELCTRIERGRIKERDTKRARDERIRTIASDLHKTTEDVAHLVRKGSKNKRP